RQDGQGHGRCHGPHPRRTPRHRPHGTHRQGRHPQDRRRVRPPPHRRAVRPPDHHRPRRSRCHPPGPRPGRNRTRRHRRGHHRPHRHRPEGGQCLRRVLTGGRKSFSTIH